MTPSEIKAALAKLGGRANKKLGQHFLIDKKVLETIVDIADIHPGDTILEIGPGLGVLTGAMLDRGAEVIAIEQDRRLAEYLTNSKLTAHRSSVFRIIHGNAAAVHWHELTNDKSWKFVSNLPYSITSLALRKALYSPRPPSSIVVLAQREVGERAIDTAYRVPRTVYNQKQKGKTSLLSLMVALASSSVRIMRHVPAGAFYPPPKVESVILQIIPMTQEDRIKRWGMEPEKIMEIARQGFAHPRKMLKSNLRLTADNLRLLGIDLKARAEDLSPEEWAKLARTVIST